ncbi:MAG: TRAP transporter large permease [Bacillota bacterium]
MSSVLLAVSVPLLVLGTPIAFAIGIGSLVALFANGTFPGTLLAHKMANGVNSFPLVAVPLFIMAGRLCGENGIARRLVRLSSVLVGHIPGGLGLVNVLASMFFGGITGSAVADTASIGALLIPAMKEDGYDSDYAAAITACSSTIGIVIPPSIPMVIYGVTIGVSIGALFLGGIIPGVLIGLLQMAVAYAISIQRKYPRARRASLRELWSALEESFLALLLPLFILGAVSFGIVTPTECAAVAVIYAFVVGAFVYREYDLRQVPRLFAESAVATSIACFVVSTTAVSAWILAIEEIPTVLASSLFAMARNPVVLLLLVNFLLMLVGCFMDLVPAMILFAPLLLPVVTKVGVDPIQFGIMMTLNLGIGLVTPPVGTCLFLASSLAEVPVMRLARACVPFLIVNSLVLLLATYWQPISLLIPRLIMH